MKLTATFAILGSAALSMVAAQTGSFTNFTNIATAPTQFTATSVSLSPVPLCVQKTCLTLIGNLSTPITQGARNSVTGRWLDRLVYTDTQDLCAVLAANGTPCPIAAGAITLNVCHPMRSMTPRNVSPPCQFEQWT
jgi:hypothetical protein